MRSYTYHHIASFMDPWKCRQCNRLPDVDEVVLLRAELAGETTLVECEQCRPANRKFHHVPKPVHSRE